MDSIDDTNHLRATSLVESITGKQLEGPLGFTREEIGTSVVADFSFHMEIIDGKKMRVPHPGECYGRVTNILGMELNGRFARVDFSTPSGTVWPGVGSAAFTRIPEDHPKLVEYERGAVERSEWYGGLLGTRDEMVNGRASANPRKES